MFFVRWLCSTCVHMNTCVNVMVRQMPPKKRGRRASTVEKKESAPKAGAAAAAAAVCCEKCHSLHCEG